MSHSHHHHHSHTHQIQGKNLFIAILLNLIITLGQVIGGIFSGSLALISDGIHNISDVAALIIAWWANTLAKKESTPQKSFGYKRAEILATLFNASVLIGIGIYLVIESMQRFAHPQVISSEVVISMALLGILLNTMSVYLLKDDAHDNMNIKAAYLHLLTDVMTSVAVLLGGLAMMFYEIYWLDSLLCLFIAFYLIKSSLSLVYESSAILMQFAPKDLNAAEIERFILQNAAIVAVEELHLWQLSDKENILEAQLRFKENLMLSEAQDVVVQLKEHLHHEFHLAHMSFGLTHVKEEIER